MKNNFTNLLINEWTEAKNSIYNVTNYSELKPDQQECLETAGK